MCSARTRQIGLHVRSVGILLPQGHTGTRGVLKDGEPALAGDRSATGLGRTWPELERRGVDAIPESGRLGTVVEHVSQVRTAVRALDLGSPHEQAAIRLFLHAPFLNGRPETWPPGSGVELRLRGKELSPAYYADVGSGLVVVPVFSRKGTFGPLVDADLVLQRR